MPQLSRLPSALPDAACPCKFDALGRCCGLVTQPAALEKHILNNGMVNINNGDDDITVTNVNEMIIQIITITIMMMLNKIIPNITGGTSQNQPEPHQVVTIHVRFATPNIISYSWNFLFVKLS